MAFGEMTEENIYSESPLGMFNLSTWFSNTDITNVICDKINFLRSKTTRI